MKYTKSILLLGALLLLFVGNIGVNIFKHSCKEDGVLVSYFIDNSDEHCNDEQSVLPPCCKEKKEKKKDDCCNDEVEYFKIKLDFFGSYSIDIPQMAPTAVAEDCEIILNPVLFDSYSANYTDPPPISSREILILNQVFII